MPDQHGSVTKPNLAFAKIVANPTPVAWSQVYNAGSLFAGLALNHKEATETTLPAIGRDIFNNLEAEFFSLEEKNLKSIKEAIVSSLDKIPEHVTANLCLAFFKDSILYLFVYGSGKISIKRGEKIGTLLEKKTSTKELITASGFLTHGDIILLQTEQFVQNVPSEIIQKSLELSLPSDIAETLSPHVHEKEEGGSAAIIIAYQGTTAAPIAPPPPQHHQPIYAQKSPLEEDDRDSDLEEDDEEEKTQKKLQLKLPPFLMNSFSNFRRKLRINKLSHLQKIILSIAVILVIVLTVSIVLTKKKQQNAQTSALFQQVYPQAKKSYDEGVALQKLNQSLAHDDFIKASDTIKNNLEKFPKGSNEEQQLQTLLTQANSELGGTAETTTSVNKVPVKEATANDNDLLNIEKSSGSSAIALAQDNSNVYALSSKAVTSTDKTTGKKTDLIKNNNDWSAPQSLAPYQGNIYILDKSKGILKFIAGSSGFAKTTYFKGTAPDVSKAQSLAIDSSIYMLMQDGSILKYTKGESDTFKTEGLSRPFSSPTKIFTALDVDNIYVLDPNNSRIVKLGKDGTFQTEYAADQIKQAKDFEVDEKNKKILFLSGNKIWQIDM